MDAKEFEELYSRAISYENVEVPKGEMTPRERFFAIMDGKKPDRIIDTEFGYWNDTLRRWHKEGLPAYVDNNSKADFYFGFDVWQKHIPMNNLLFPSFPVETISDDGKHRVIYDSDHVKCEVFSDGADTIPHYLEFPVKDAATWRELFKPRMKVDPLGRIKVDPAKLAAQVKDRNFVLVANGGSTAGKIRDWMGFEDIAFAIYDQPELLEEMLADISAVSSANARALTEAGVVPDLVSWWEDIAFKTGPIVTPAFFNEKCGAAIRKVMDVYRAAGTKYSFVDCDGDFRRIMPGWLENGVNIMFPLEVNAGIHPADLRRDHAGIRMMGGVDKVVLMKSKAEIKAELLKLKPLVEAGAYIPHVDHRVQADIPYENYLYYLEVKRDLFGIPNRIRA
ncbi:MAG: hypothetical protein J0L75_05500 [Spirochaetes bacterium]|nr:hypothetical protein [Spirochaetota bacterium]